MNEILDGAERESNKGHLFSRLAFAFSLLSLFSLIKFSSYIPNTIKASQSLESPPKLLGYLLLGAAIFGLLFSCSSFYRREKQTIVKWLGGIINLLIFLLLLGSIAFSRLV